MLLFFKGVYRSSILSGEKTDTIRANKRVPKLGSVVLACVGPSRIFARLRITGVESLADISPERRRQVEKCYGVIPENAVRLTFELLEATSNSQLAA
jgi:hypothetical protein